jgi:phosphoribosylformylglycinamidine synthase
MDDAALREALSALGLALSLTEARRVAELLGHDPTETELTLFDTMWSEHCSYKSSRGVLERFLPTKASNVILGPSEDAGIIHFAQVDGIRYGLAVAHESHNHPSQIMPVDGAATGIGGVVRDVYCMGAEVIATLDPLRFGDPSDKNGERCLEIAREVVEGIALYGNALGVPNLGGDLCFDACYDDNCLVNVVAIGLVEENRITRSRVPQAAREEPYDFLLVGKPTDGSGMGGASFASADLDEEELRQNLGSVQVPDPFLKRMLVLANQAMLELVHHEGAQIGFKDLGAGGIACVSSELADAAGMGIELDLDHASISPEDLPDPVAACSETQERFGIACPARLTERILKIYNDTYELNSMYEGAGARRVGRIKVPAAGETPRYLLRRGKEVLVDAPISTITAGIRYEREARASAREVSVREPRIEGRKMEADLLELLASAALCSRRALFQHFDSEVKASTVLRPGEADAGVVAPIEGSPVGMAATVDGNPRYCRTDPYLGAAHAVVEAARNVACVGAAPAAITDCLNFGNPEIPEVFHSFVESVRGIGDACRGLGRLEAPEEPLPVISGNVSFYNQSASGRAVDPSPIICCVGVIPDSSVCRSLSLKEAGNLIYRVGDLRSEMGGSVYAEWVDPKWVGTLPALDFGRVRNELQLVVDLVREGRLQAVHDVSEGGTLVALAEMALGPESLGRCGLEVDLTKARETVGEAAAAFGEAGGFLLELKPTDAAHLQERTRERGISCTLLGEVIAAREFKLTGLSQPIRLSLDELKRARESTMPRLLAREEL